MAGRAMDTIFALATARGRAGIAVVRISGPAALAAAEGLAGPLPERGRSLRRLRDASKQVLDEALVLTFAAGHSFTGEPVVELHLHGSPAVTAAVLSELGRELRPAEAGEFTRRALENGRLDLAQVEGLADLIEAETESQRRQALRVLSGELGKKAEEWRSALVRAAALLEVTIDFSDEDVPMDVTPDVLALIRPVEAELRREAAGARISERIRDGFEVAILGAPNAGKSTLLNRLAGREAAITSENAGTTRDVIEVRLDLGGLPVILLDTAGLREAQDPIEGKGIERARERARAADLRIYLVGPGERPQFALDEDDLLVASKADLWAPEGLAVSAVTGEGIDPQVEAVATRLSRRANGAGIAIRERHRLAMSAAADYLEKANMDLQEGASVVELIAEDLRAAMRSIESIMGHVDVEHLLDDIFASFCIGK